MIEEGKGVALVASFQGGACAVGEVEGGDYQVFLVSALGENVSKDDGFFLKSLHHFPFELHDLCSIDRDKCGFRGRSSVVSVLARVLSKGKEAGEWDRDSVIIIKGLDILSWSGAFAPIHDLGEFCDALRTVIVSQRRDSSTYAVSGVLVAARCPDERSCLEEWFRIRSLNVFAV